MLDRNMRGMKSKLHNEEPHNLSLLVKMLIPPLHSLLTDFGIINSITKLHHFGISTE
jgi:hypothetical protein